MGHVLGSVREVMSSPAETVPPDTTVSAASHQLIAHDIGSLVVGEESLEGIVTKTDLLGVIAADGDPDTTAVSTVVSRPVVTVGPDTQLTTAAGTMDDHDIKHLVVVEEAPVGIVTTTDITHALAPDTAALVEEFLPTT
ncbi:hypothetical protein DP107_04385 [Haloglomus irregulare]|uniref:CBS domain-containing protein n=1 Tax=Haloglomus irregulare TaxID=2234134 RepID=A0A554NCK4_9EURY|nr:CBS domain-containing protein [Haloglomus irregulare]TSD15098.1 hypothetical protein DP107_04385 [Haloglomus irregulare]